ncbi:peptidylprolyl isomerase [Bacteroidales bacterium]|nr:peptidylprolyl isomerase [Bacteroidales bacterium]
MIKKLYFTFFCACCIQFSSSQLFAQDNIIDEVVWVVGDEAILKSDIENVRLEMQMRGERMSGDPYCVVPEQMAIQKLYLHQAKLDSVETSDSEVLRQVEQWINGAINQVGSKEKLEEYLNKPMAMIREEQRTNMKEGRIVSEMQSKIIGEVRLTPADVRRFYSQIPQDSLPFIPTTVEVEIVTLEPKISLEETDRVKAKLREFTDKATRGESEFSTLARMWSEDVESAKRGGELGFNGKTELVPEFATVAFGLNDPKRISKITETEYGFHIMQLIEKRGDRVNVRHILLKPKVSDDEIQEAITKLDSVANDIAIQKFTFEEAATYLSFDKDTRNNKGLMVNSGRSENSGTSRFQMQELPQEIGKVIYNMQVGEVSQPFKMINSKQKDVVAIVRLKTRVDGHKANMSDDYQTLKSLVEEKKREELLDKWIAKKQKDTYIRINDNWKNCDFQRVGWIKE